MNKKGIAILFALLAAALYAMNVPLSKLLLQGIEPTMLAGFLYLGAGVGMGAFMLGKRISGRPRKEQFLEKKDLPYTIAMVVLDIAAPILLMYGILKTSSANVSLLNNFEIVATAVIALLVFGEKISPRLWGAIAMVTVAGVILGFEGLEGLTFNKGSLLVLGACLCWGIENNCTRSISHKSSQQIVTIKGFGSGLGSILVALALGERFPPFPYLLLTMALGFVAYGLSINFYILAQKTLGAAKTSSFYSVAPFLGVGFSFLLLGEQPRLGFYLALGLMALATAMMIWDTLDGESLLPGYTHSHAHRHGDVIHTHEHRHAALSPLHMHLHSHS